MSGVIVDYFAGGGGASTGLELAYGRKVDLAVNHDVEALAMHLANHPETEHACSDVFEFDVVAWLGTRTWDAWWTSPDCTHHSRAKGGKPVSNKRRALADVVVETVQRLPAWQMPRVIHLENVPEFLEWGPLDETGRPDKARKGEDFAAWRGRLEALGYAVEHRIVVCADFGDPTTRKRLMLIARCDGLPIVWPEPTHYNPKAKRKPGAPRRKASMHPWRTAAECIDFSIPGKSIFGREKLLADATLRRVARGTRKFVIDNPKPFVVPVTHPRDARVHAVDEPFRTITAANRGELTVVTPHLVGVTQSSSARNFAADAPLNTITTAKGGEHLLASACLVQTGYGERDGQAPRTLDVDKPLGTVVADGNKFALAAAHMLRLQGSVRRDAGADEPLGAVCSQGTHHAQVAAFMAQHNLDNVGHDMRAPMSTIVTRGCTQGLVEVDLTAEEIEEGCERVLAFMIKYYGSGANGEAVDEPLDTVTTKDRFALITVHIEGVPYRIFDIRIRMLTARELFNAQGFPRDYIIDPMVPLSPFALAREVKRGSGITHKRMSKGSSIAKCGNSVPPNTAAAHARANAPPLSRLEGASRWERRAA